MYKADNVRKKCSNEYKKEGQKYKLTRIEVYEVDYEFEDMFYIKEQLENDLKQCKIQRDRIDEWEKETLDNLEKIEKICTTLRKEEF